MSFGKKLCQGVVAISVWGSAAHAETKVPVTKKVEAEQEKKASLLPNVVAELLKKIDLELDHSGNEPIC